MLKQNASESYHACEKCPKTFRSNDLLVDHLKIVHEEIHPFKCAYCDQLFKTMSTLDSHLDEHIYMKSTNRSTRVNCLHCDHTFANEKNRAKHILKVHKKPKEKKFTCKICNGRFFFHSGHSKYFHKKQTSYDCDLCDKSFNCPMLLSDHILAVHENVKRYECEHCGQNFFSRSNLVMHIISHSKSYKCEKCSETFVDKKELKKHMSKMHYIQGILYQCIICDRDFKTKSLLRSHKRRMHEIEIHQCEHCDKLFTTELSLNIHINANHEKCEDCGLTFKNKFYMKKHKKKMHEVRENSILYHCDKCDHFYSNQTLLNAHVIAEHSSEMDFNCHICDRTFRSKYRLNTHVTEMHDDRIQYNPQPLVSNELMDIVKSELPDENNLKCDQCQKIFPSQRSLKRHVSNMHEAKLHPCDFCDKLFSTEYQLQNHENSVHIRNRPFKCPCCKNDYKTKGALFAHIKNKH